MANDAATGLYDAGGHGSAVNPASRSHHAAAGDLGAISAREGAPGMARVGRAHKGRARLAAWTSRPPGLRGRGHVFLLNSCAKTAQVVIMGRMKNRKLMQSFAPIASLCAGLALVCSVRLAANEPPPEATYDGLHLYKQTKQRIAYVRPGATFTQYKRLAVYDCYVEFSKEWVEHYNRDQSDPSRQIRASDIERAKKALQDDFTKIFTEELQQRGRYQVTDTPGPDVLILRPALINIQVSAPDLISPGRSATFVQSAGTMTIYLELWDSASNTILARVIDAKVDPSVYGQRSSSVTNRAAADRMMRSWADELRSRLDFVRGKDVAP